MKPKIGGSLIVPLDSHNKAIESKIIDFKTAGYDFAELALSLKFIPNESFEERVNTLRKKVPILSAHLPDINHKKKEIERCNKFIEILSNQGIHIFVIHLYSPTIQTEENFDLKINTLKCFIETAKKKGTTLVLENTEEYASTLQRVFEEIPNIDFCLDIGHANLFAKENRSIKLIDAFEKRLKHVHISDNIGGDSESADLHLPIGEGNINFEPIFDKLNEINYSGNITLELYKPKLETVKKSLKVIRELF